MPADRVGPVAGVILAAGSSSRMGRNKLFFEIIEGETLLRRAATTAVSAGLEPVVVVLGFEAERGRAELAGVDVQVESNPDFGRGLGSSLRVGLAAVPPEAIGAVVMLADMPFVTPEMLMTLTSRYRTSAAPLVVSSYGEVQAPPVLYDRSLFAELGSVDADWGGRQVIRSHYQDALVVSWPQHTAMDLDTPDDIMRARAGRTQDR